MKSRQPKAQQFWKEVAPDGQTPSAETVITLIAKKLMSGCVVEVLMHLIFVLLIVGFENAKKHKSAK
ncbi:MAG: hypothetical protein ACLSHG_05030 [Oscillospiraceae bacterium]